MNGLLIERRRLTAGQRIAMRELMDRYFLGVTAAVFERDLAGKDYAVLLTSAGGTLCGFTTFAVDPVRFASELLWVVYSGDTIVDRASRGSFALARTWIDSIRGLRSALGGGRMVWLLICSSPRTYRFLPLFFRRYYPQAGRLPWPEARRLIDRLARRRYGDAYDAASGIVRLPDPQPLRPEIRPVAAAGRDDHDRCFLRANPGHLRGDELVCFADLGDANLTPAGLRMVGAGANLRGGRQGSAAAARGAEPAGAMAWAAGARR